MTGYPDYETYRDLYARYYDRRDVAELVALLLPVADLQVLDLCAGEGKLTLAALDAGARQVTLVDVEAVMVSPEMKRHPKVDVHIKGVLEALRYFNKQNWVFDCVVCRQAVNYWLTSETARLLADVMEEAGVFVFNTFNEQPPEEPTTRIYEIDEHMFAEVSWRVGDTVHHLQWRDGIPVHQTSFAWISPEKFREILSPRFDVREIRDGKTSIYKCTKK